jgi:hypothetical protein
MTLPPPFPATPAFTKWVKTIPLDDDIKALARKDFPGMGIAVVDLTISSRTGTSPGFISYGGADDNIERYAGSMPKIAAMYAGYRLRERLNNAAGALAATKADDVFAEVEAAWKPVISTAYPKKPPDFPKLKRIFKVIGGPGAWTFAFTNSNMDWNTLNGLHEHALPAGMGFRDRMKLSIGWSDNDATGSLVEDLGRQYINGALAAEGLYDRTSNKGLWLSGNYDGVASGAWETKPDSGDAQGATAATTAAFLMLMDTNRLVDAPSSTDMRENIMGVPWFHTTLQAQGRPATAYGKVGIDTGKDKDRHDCGVITRTEPGGLRFRYAAVALNARDNSVLDDLIVKLDDIMKKFVVDFIL